MSTTDRDQAVLPMGLRERVMAASLLARAVGQPVPAVPAISADEAFARAADAFYGLLGTLSEQGWKTGALRGLDVQELVGHLAGVEHDTHRALAGDPAVADAEHVESTQGSLDRDLPSRCRAQVDIVLRRFIQTDDAFRHALALIDDPEERARVQQQFHRRFLVRVPEA